MKYTIIGENPDNTLTVRLFVGERVYDRIIDRPVLPTLDDLVADVVNPLMDDLQAQAPTEEELADPEQPIFEVQGVDPQYLAALNQEEEETHE